MNAQCFWLSSQSGQTQITVGQKHWCCAGGRRWCGAGSPSALMMLLCVALVALVVLLFVWCVVGTGARAHQERDEERERYILRPPKLVRMRVRVRIRVHVTGGVLARGLTCVGRLSERPHWRWPKQGAAVVKQGGLGELSGLCKVYRPKRRPAEGAVLFRPIMWLYSASVVLGSTLHLALAIFQQGAPCFGHRPKKKLQTDHAPFPKQRIPQFPADLTYR